MCVCVFFPFILDIKFVGRTSREEGHTVFLIRLFSAVRALIFLARILFEELLSLLVNSRSGINRFCKKYLVQYLVPHDYIKPCTVYTVVQQHVCVCFLPIHSGHQVRWTYQPGGRSHRISHPPSFCGACLNFQVRWTYQPGSHRRKVTQYFSSTFLLCVP